MSIDSIGKGAPPPSPHPLGSGAKEVTAPGKSFESVLDSRTAGASPIAAPVPSIKPLDRLRAGEINVEQYLDLKVEHATSMLKGLGASDLSVLRSALRDHIASDPDVAALVKKATGQAPLSPDE